ncbi:hypothetical protein [uncultured Anaerotruncus sp.]|uniref:hypothetical protein n=1 Tax=uncultured Anaerotruncus sp. TaxID=905011 RepID=UPI00280B3FF2|nr:hypothetical protein [uncultured Anaerotruncus sp.]
MEVLIAAGLLFIGAVGFLCARGMDRFMDESRRPRWNARRARPAGAVIFLTHGPVQK